MTHFELKQFVYEIKQQCRYTFVANLLLKEVTFLFDLHCMGKVRKNEGGQRNQFLIGHC